MLPQLQNHSTQHALISLAYLFDSLDNNLVTFVMTLDFKKGFDKVDKNVIRIMLTRLVSKAYLISIVRDN